MNNITPKIEEDFVRNINRRPLLSRLLPDRFKPSLYYRWYHFRHAQHHDLFGVAPLAFTPDISMYSLPLGDIISGNVAFNGFHELALSKRLHKLAQRGGTFVDVGANMGYFSLLWAGTGPLNHVIAFEPAPRNIALLQNNIDQNHLANRITHIPKAAGHHPCTITFDLGPEEQTGWGGISTTASSSSISV